MKRDARIGLAMVLVLGLAVTLLVGRALYNRGEPVDEEHASGDGSATYSSEVARVDGADVTTANVATPRNEATNPGTAVQPNPETAVITAQQMPVDQTSVALQRFVDDQHRPLNTGGPAVNTPNPPVNGVIPAPAPNTNTLPRLSPNPQPGPQPNPPVIGMEHAGADCELPRVTTMNSTLTATTPAEGYAYTISAGDNMWKISSKVYGDGKYTQKILEANPGLDAKKLKVGSTIRIPNIPNKTVLMKLPSFGERNAPVVAEARTGLVTANSTESVGGGNTGTGGGEPITHKVESGETLSSIARKYFGASGPKTIAKITAANPRLDPAKLKVGQELVIPKN